MIGLVYYSRDTNDSKFLRKDVREIFEPVVSQVLELISKQVIEVLKSGKGPVAVSPRFTESPLHTRFVCWKLTLHNL